MTSKTRTASIILGICAAFDAVAVIAQRAGSTHPPVLVTILTALAAVVTAAGAFGLNRGDHWAWPTALGGAVLTAVLAVGAIIHAPVGAKIGAAVVLVLSLISLVVLLPLRRTGQATHS